MKDADNGGAAMPGRDDQLDDSIAVRAVERGGRLVEQQDRVPGDQAASDIDAAAVRRPRRSPAAAPTCGAGSRARRAGTRPARAPLPDRRRAAERLGHQVERRDARDDAEKLADETDRPPPHIEHDTRRGPAISTPVEVADQDVTRLAR